MKKPTTAPAVAPVPLRTPPEPVADLEVKASDGWPLVRGQWVRSNHSALGLKAGASWSGKVTNIAREVDGKFAGRVLVFAHDGRFERITTPEHCSVRRPPRDG